MTKNDMTRFMEAFVDEFIEEHKMVPYEPGWVDRDEVRCFTVDLMSGKATIQTPWQYDLHSWFTENYCG